MTVDKYLDQIDELLDNSWNLPLGEGKAMVDMKKLRNLIDDLRLNLPQEVKDAKAIVADRELIISDAKAEANSIIQKAEQKSRQMISQNEILKEAQNQSNEVLLDTKTRVKELERKSVDFSENTLKKAEDALALALNQVKSTRMAIHKQINGNKQI